MQVWMGWKIVLLLYLKVVIVAWKMSVSGWGQGFDDDHDIKLNKMKAIF